ncbi:hypothetical protein IID10_04270 [candidate division KSB1 bacterium]|nr:hypothetical protein [candidate division KSB1 bacterium]
MANSVTKESGRRPRSRATHGGSSEDFAGEAPEARVGSLARFSGRGAGAFLKIPTEIEIERRGCPGHEIENHFVARGFSPCVTATLKGDNAGA